jgi:hypothetical protein|tara:strand:- start:3035 stop:3163 length:129 start_codon:yes stop_codon:yes gene_type:complete
VVEDGTEFIAALDQGLVAIFALFLGFCVLVILAAHENVPPVS